MLIYQIFSFIAVIRNRDDQEIEQIIHCHIGIGNLGNFLIIMDNNWILYLPAYKMHNY